MRERDNFLICISTSTEGMEEMPVAFCVVDASPHCLVGEVQDMQPEAVLISDWMLSAFAKMLVHSQRMVLHILLHVP